MAVGFGVIKATISTNIDWFTLMFAGVVGLLLAPATVAALWLAMGYRRELWRFALFVVCPVASAAAMEFIFSEDFDGMNWISTIFIAGICLLSLLVVRKCGYRFVRLPVEAFDEPVRVEKKPPDAMSDGLG